MFYVKQTFPPPISIFNKGEGDGIESRLPLKIFSTLNVKNNLPLCLSFKLLVLTTLAFKVVVDPWCWLEDVLVLPLLGVPLVPVVWVPCHCHHWEMLSPWKWQIGTDYTCLLGFGLSTGVICYLIKKYICERLNRIEIFLSKREIYKLDIIKFIECFTNNKSDKKNFKIQEVPAFLVPKSNHEMRGSLIRRTDF